MRKRLRKTDASRKKFLTIRKFLIFSIAVFVLCVLSAFAILLKHVFTQSSHTIVNPAIAEISVDDLRTQLIANNIQVDTIKTTDGGDTFTVQISKGPTVVFSRVKDLQLQIKTLVELLSKFSIDNKQPISIDFQYTKPIVKF